MAQFNQVMVVQGCEPSTPGSNVPSAVTIWSDAVTKLPWDPNRCVCLHWFCGQLKEWDPRQTTLFLLGQLFLNGVDTIPVPDYEVKPGHHARVFGQTALLDTLQRGIIHQLKHTGVVVIIDAINFYHDTLHKPTQSFFNTLAAIATLTPDNRFRFVVTSPTTSDIANGLSSSATVATITG